MKIEHIKRPDGVEVDWVKSENKIDDAILGLLCEYVDSEHSKDFVKQIGHNDYVITFCIMDNKLIPMAVSTTGWPVKQQEKPTDLELEESGYLPQKEDNSVKFREIKSDDLCS